MPELAEVQPSNTQNENFNTQDENKGVLSNEAGSEQSVTQNTAEQAPAPETGEKTEEVITPEQAAKREGRRFERRLGNALRREAEARAKAEAYERELSQLRQAQQPPADPGAPRIENFSDIEDFRKAVEKHAFERGLKESEAKRQAEARQREQVALMSAWEKKVDAASAKYEDFDEKVGELKPVNEFIVAIMDADNGADIAYYLGSHPDEVQRIAQLSPIAQMRAIGRLEAKLAAEPTEPKTPSKAPAPIKPVGGKSGGASDVPLDSDDINTWMRKENARLRKAAGA
jgi:hypothetical protein